MAKLDIVAGATSVSLAIFIQDSSSTTGDGLTGLVYNSSGLTCYAVVPGSSAAAISLATLAAPNSAYSSGGFKEIDSTHMAGWYRFDVPNTNISTGRSVGIHFYGATNMAPLPLEISLTGWNNQDAVHGGLSALPNTAVTTNASLLTSGTGTDQLSVASGKVDAGKINGVSTSSVTTVNANVGTTQPLNFTGTAGSALVKCDVVDIAGSAVSTSSAQLGVNVVQMNTVSTSSVTTINANQGTTQPVNFTGTGASALAKSDVVDIAGAAVSTSTAQLGVNLVNIAGSAVSTTTAQLGVNAVQVNAVSTSSVTAVNANVGTTQPVNFTGTAGSALVKTDVIDIAGSAVSSGSAQLGVNVVQINTVSTSPVTTVKAVQGLTTADTITTYTGNTPQTGDNYALLTGANTELSAVPASTASLVSMLKWVFLLARNKLTQTATTQTTFANDDSTTVATSTVSDDGTTATRGKFS